MLKKKCKSIVLVILCLFVFSIQIISAQSLPLQDTIIMVDAGHGGRDSGTYYGDILEKDINLEIAKELEVETEEVSLSLGAIQDPVSLQEPVFNDGTENIFIIDQVSDSKNTDERWTESITIAELMKKLNDKEKMIINKRFFDGRTQMEVAEEIGISQAQVSRLEKSAISHIKRLYN